MSASAGSGSTAPPARRAGVRADHQGCAPRVSVCGDGLREFGHRLRRHLQHADALLPFRRAFGLRDWGPLVSRDTRARPPAVPLSSGAGEAPPPAARMPDQITFGQRVNVGLQYAGDRLAQGALQEEPGRSPVGRGRPYVWRMPSTVREVRSIEFGPGAFLLAGIDLSSVRPCDLVREHLSIGRKAGAFNLCVRVLEPGSDQRFGTMEKRFFHRHLQGGNGQPAPNGQRLEQFRIGGDLRLPVDPKCFRQSRDEEHQT